MVLRACRVCKYLTEGKKCEMCGSEDLTTKWKGVINIVDPGRSEIAKELGITKPGKYALSVE
ncbi:MAG: transcription elongation factor subunit Spt4 [Nanoarchaeota archaeon]|nr:transcription elongation factor subunit Spt4 [Nanoarchaeota archaeon]